MLDTLINYEHPQIKIVNTLKSLAKPVCDQCPPSILKKKNTLPKFISSHTLSIFQNSHSILSLLPLRLSLSGLRLCCCSISSSSAFVYSSLHLTSSRLINCQPTTPLFHSSPTTWISLSHSFYFLLLAFCILFFKCLLFYFIFLFFNWCVYFFYNPFFKWLNN